MADNFFIVIKMKKNIIYSYMRNRKFILEKLNMHL